MTMKFRHDAQAAIQQNQLRRAGARYLIGALFSIVVYSGPGHANENFASVEKQGVAHSHGLLDGLSFSGPTGTRGMRSDHVETVLFVDGEFRTRQCEKWGFEKRAYRAESVGDAVRFEAVHVSPDYGTMTWHGTVRKGRLEAHYVWEKERLLWDTRREYWFKGVISGARHEHYRAF